MPNNNVKSKASASCSSRTRTNRVRRSGTRKSRSSQQSRQGGGSNNTAVRTPGTIISALAKQASAMKLSNLMSTPYAMARLTCCVPRTVPGIPDGSSNKSIKVCLYAVDRLTFSAVTTAILQFNPWIPTPVQLVGGAGTTRVNGSQSVITVGGQGVGMGIAAPFQIQESQSRPGNTSNAADVFSATNFRIVSQTHAIRYTGPVTTCSGVIRSFPNDWTLSDGGRVTVTSATATTPTGAGICVAVRNSGAVITGFAPLGTEILSIDGPTANTVLPTAGTLSCRPEQGMTVRLTHKTGKYEAQPLRNIPPALTWFANSTTTGLAVLEHYYMSNETNTQRPMVLGYDNDWTGQTVMLENVNADASYSIETCICVEFSPQPTSTMYTLATGSPPKNQQVLDAVERELKTRGPAIPGIANSY